jgi:hypothetical protein
MVAIHTPREHITPEDSLEENSGCSQFTQSSGDDDACSR